MQRVLPDVRTGVESMNFHRFVALVLCFICLCFRLFTIIPLIQHFVYELQQFRWQNRKSRRHLQWYFVGGPIKYYMGSTRRGLVRAHWFGRFTAMKA